MKVAKQPGSHWYVTGSGSEHWPRPESHWKKGRGEECKRLPGPGPWAGHLLESSEKKTFRGQGKHRFLPKVHASSSSLPGLQCPYSALPLQQSPFGISEAALDAPRMPGENWAWGGHWAIQFTKPSNQQVPFVLTMPQNPCFLWNYSLLQPWCCSWPASVWPHPVGGVWGLWLRW